MSEVLPQLALVVVQRLESQSNQFLATIQIAITLAGFLASAAAAVSLAEPLEEPLGLLGGMGSDPPG